ncbi:MAG TPA: alginate lyase family protein [Blastocatellia bacterium]|nr:alginate lyase family protein [Blastocatellia bacterium]
MISMSSASRLYHLWQHFGPRWLAHRVGYAARLRSGAIAWRLPARAWQAQPLEQFLKDAALADPERYLDYRKRHAPPFFFASADRERYQPLFAAWDDVAETTPLIIAAQIKQGRLRYFERRTAQTGFPPDWHANPFTGERGAADLHWSRIGDFDSGDIKIIWEPSRFAYAYALARAYWRTGDEDYVEQFWRAAEDWRVNNPPQQGANWKCGQEAAFRVMAWCFALYAFLDSPQTTAARVGGLAQMIAITAERIAANFDHALSQGNNHGISEAAGLYTVGLLFREFKAAASWRQRGRAALESEGRKLIYDDGAFTQHSTNYHRLMLHDYLWPLRLGELLGEPFSDELKHRIARAGDFLYQLQDTTSGRVPNYGHNDGALVLPLDNGDFQDYRPVVQATHYLIDQTRCYAAGPWDEDLLWLFGPRALAAPVAPPPRADLQAECGGYYTLRSPAGFAFVRAATFKDRPAQADMLHVDLWWRGENIATDAGTFSYHAPAPWDNELARTAYHNTVMVDGCDQMERAGRFLWLPWLRGGMTDYRRSAGGHLVYWHGEHDGYRRLPSPVAHRRAVMRVGDECWVVADQLLGGADHDYRLQWLFADLPFAWDEAQHRLTLHTAAGAYAARLLDLSGAGRCSIMRADPRSARGWRSAYYYDREPALSLDLRCHAARAAFITIFAPDDYSVTAAPGSLVIRSSGWRAVVHLDASANERLIASAAIDGALTDRLEMA